jgi:hypothetical protein
MQYLVKFMQRLVKLMQYLVKFLHEVCEVHAVFHEVHALVEGVFKGNPNVLLTKHVPPACEHLLLILDVLL